MTWTSPDFESLPKTAHPDFRLVGSSLMDEEQYHVERWEVNEQGYWRASIEGMNAYFRLRERRKGERREAWRARQEADDAWTQEVMRMLPPEAA